MRKDESSRGGRVWVGAALAAAVGTAWVIDARRRDEGARMTHRILIDLLLNALTADDALTARHSRRVADLSFALAERCGMPRKELATLRVAALLHDMGKIENRFWHIVHSHEPLTPEQREEIQFHPHLSARILEPLEPIHPGIMRIVASHHECWNGEGYPSCLSGDEIPLGARIIALADVFDAVTQPRAYKDPMPVEDAIAQLRRGEGRQFDPQLVALVDSEPLSDEWARIALRGQEDERKQLEADRAAPDPTPQSPPELGEGQTQASAEGGGGGG